MEGRDIEGELLAEWEQQLRFLRVEREGTEQLVVEQLDGDGHTVTCNYYAQEDFPLAADNYASWLADALDPAGESAAQVLRRTLQAIARADVEALKALFHEDYFHIDHRPLGSADANKAGMIDSQILQSDMAAVWLARTMEAWNFAGCMSRGAYWTPYFGRWTPFEFGIHLGVVENGQVLRAEIFPEDQLDAALARFAELTSPRKDT